MKLIIVWIKELFLLAKIVEDASPRRHAEIIQVKVKATHLMNNKLPPAEFLCGEWMLRCWGLLW